MVVCQMLQVDLNELQFTQFSAGSAIVFSHEFVRGEIRCCPFFSTPVFECNLAYAPALSLSYPIT